MDRDYTKPSNVIEALIAGHSARTWIERHANDFAYSDKGMCSQCRNYCAALLRAIAPKLALPLACQELRDAVSEVDRARNAARHWQQAEVQW